MIRFVGLDLDGTLLGGTQPHYGIREEAVAALFDAHRRGVQIGIVTWRDFDFIYQTLLEHEIDPAKTSFPSLIIAEERRIYALEGGAYRPDAEWNDRIVADERGHLNQVASLVGRLLETDLAQMDPGLRRVEAAIEERRGFVELVFSDRESAEAGAALLAERLRSTVPDIVPIRNGRGVALRHVRASKGATLNRYAETSGLRPEEILAIGDSENDRSMLDGRFGFRAATVSNADESIRRLVAERGGYVAEGACGVGVAEAMADALGAANERSGA